MNIFFCDIIGTFDGKTNRKEYIDAFLEHLIKLSEKYKDLEFCFISTEKLEDIQKYIDEVSPILKENNIKLGKQFAGDYELENGIKTKINKKNKIDQIKDYINNKNIETIFYADDSKMNQKITFEVLKRIKPDAKVINLVPGSINHFEYESEETGIKGLLEAIKIFIEKERKEIKKRIRK